MSDADQKIAGLRVDVDTSAADTAGQKLDQFTAKAKLTETQVRAIDAAAKRAGISFDEMAQRIANASNVTDKEAGSVGKATTATNAHADAMRKHSSAADENSKQLGKIAEIASILEARELRLANSFGIVGEALAVIGPTGLAVAAGIGAVIVAIDKMVSSADRMGQLAKQLDNVATITGLTTNELQALENKGVEFGLSTTETGQALTRFTSQMTALRDGSGTLATQLRKIDPELLAQISSAKSTTEAINILAKAYKLAGDNKNALANAAVGSSGRSAVGAQFGGLLGNIDERAGVENVTGAVNKLDFITKEQIDTWKKLSVEIEDATSTAKNNIASIFTTSVLEAEKDFSDKFLEFSRELKDFKFSSDFQKFIDVITSPVTIVSAATVSFLLAPWLSLAATAAAITAKLSIDAVKLGAVHGAMENPESLTPTFSPPQDLSSDESSGLNTKNRNNLAGTLGVQATASRLLTAALGGAASATDQLKAKQDALNLSYERGELGLKGSVAAEEALGRARAGNILEKDIALNSARTGALGAAATLTDLLTQKELSLQKARETGASFTPTEIANQKRLVEEQFSGVAAVKAQIDAAAVQQATIGMSVGAAAAYTAVQTKLNENIRNGTKMDAEQEAALRSTAAALGAKTQAAAQDAAQAQADFDKQTVFLSDIDKQIAQIQFRLHGKDWQNWMGDGLVSTMRLTDTNKMLSDSFNEVGKAALSAFLSGSHGADAMVTALDSVAKKLSDSAFTNILSGNIGTGLVQAGASVLISLFTSDAKAKKELQAAKDAWKGMTDQLTAFNEAAKGISVGPLTSQLQSLVSSLKTLSDAALKAKDMKGIVSVQDTFNKGWVRVVDEFLVGAQTLTPLQQSMKAVSDEGQGLIDTLTALAPLPVGLADQINASVKVQQDALQALFKTTTEGGLRSDINTATGVGYLNDVAAALQKFNDLSSQNIDKTLLNSWLQNTVQKVIDDAGLVGDAFTDFTKQFPQLASIVTESSDALAAAAKTQQDALNTSAKSILEYVNGLQTSQSSTLSPTQILANAQSVYNANLSLAQGGNTDAMGKFTSVADNLEKAARAVYASSPGYQNIRNQIVSQGLALPAVTGTTDPLLQAMRDVSKAINDAAVTAAKDATVGGLLTSTQLAQAGLATQVTAAGIKASGDTTAAKTTSVEQATWATNSNSYQTANNVATGNAFLLAIQGLQGTAKDQLILLTGQFTAAPFLSSASSGGDAGVQVFTGDYTIQHSMLQALNGIELNTAATALNTWINLTAADSPYGRRGEFSAYVGQGGGTVHLASGGWVKGGTPGKDSVPILSMPDEFVLNTTATRALTSKYGRGVMDLLNRGQLPTLPNAASFGVTDNDNSLDVRSLKAEIIKLQSIMASGTNMHVKEASKNAAAIVEAVVTGTGQAAATGRMAKRKQR